MRARSDPRRRERAVGEIAERQHGVIARAQLLGLSFGRGAIRHRTATGRLHAVHREVYAVGHRRLTVYGRWMAAVLACGPDAALSHRSAAALWGLAPASGARVDVTTPRRSGSSRPGIRLHRVRKMHPRDLAVRDGIPVTSVARTLLDLAEIVDPGGLGRMLEEAERRRLLDLRAVEQACARGHGRRGLKPLVTHLRTLRPAPETRSELERRFLALCRELALPPPDVNALVEGFEVDAVWSDGGLVVELDGYAFHHTRGAFERDRARDATLQLAGYRVLRLTARRLAEEPEAVAETVRGLLAQPPTGDAAGQSAR